MVDKVLRCLKKAALQFLSWYAFYTHHVLNVMDVATVEDHLYPSIGCSYWQHLATVSLPSSSFALYGTIFHAVSKDRILFGCPKIVFYILITRL